MELRRIAEATGIGVLNTVMAKGVVGRHSPSSLFTIGLQAKDYPALAIDEADLVIAIGYDIVEYPPKLWNPNGDKRIVHFDSLPAEVDESYNAEVEVVGDLANALLRLNGLVEENPFHKDHDAQLALRETMLADFAEHAEDDTEGIVRPQKVMWDVREALGSSDILLSDVGAHKMWIARYYQCDEPNTCLIPNGFAAMGFALPGAISARIVHPERRSLPIAGDGGFLMNVEVLDTAVRRRCRAASGPAAGARPDRHGRAWSWRRRSSASRSSLCCSVFCGSGFQSERPSSRPRARSAASTSAPSQPAKQLTRSTPSCPSLMDRLGVRSSWHGQRAMP